MRARILSAACLTACLIAAASAYGAEQPVVVNSGTATAHAAPATVEFTLLKDFKESDLKTSAEKCAAFVTQAQESLRAGDVQPLDVQAIPGAVVSTADKMVHGGVMAHFSMNPFNIPNTGPLGFATLCDKITAMATALGAKLGGPKFKPAESDSAAAQAVTKATENAYAAAESLAFALKSAIYSVQEAEILELTWSETQTEMPGEVPQLSCTAKVRITYMLAPQAAAGTL
jgi:uncharacterized protein YggE